MKNTIENIFLKNDSPSYNIAEIGINHNGDVEVAKRRANRAFERVETAATMIEESRLFAICCIVFEVCFVSVLEL